jgi:hypothetical protein
MFTIHAYANGDHAFVVWRPDAPISNCLGFALFRKPDGKDPQIVETFVGPKTETQVPAGTRRLSTEWPIQKFMWADYLAVAGTHYTYRVVPMVGAGFDDMRQDEDAASAWSDSVSLSLPSNSPVQPYFNRGIVSTQWVAHALLATEGKTLKQLVDPPSGTTPMRDFLGGALKQQFLTMLAAENKAGAHLYASLFELNDPEVLPALLAFGQRAHIILSDGTHAPPKQEAQPGTKGLKPRKSTDAKKSAVYDENADARAQLRNGHVELHDRMVTGQHFSHHKFIVFTDPQDTTRAKSVWTGSTNLTYGGLCTQANNGLLISDATIAGRFLDQWRTLVRDRDGYPPALEQFDAKGTSTSLDGGPKITAWFAPNPKAKGKAPKGSDGNKYGDHPDLQAARKLIIGAQKGILFLVFNPGYNGTLLNDILDLATGPRSDELYIHGVANQDPTGGKGRQPLIFVHRGQKQKAEQEVVLPGAINVGGALEKKDRDAAKALNDWVRLVSDYWKTEPTGLGMVRVHSKVILVDPFDKHPVVITGSHNLGPKASAVNDDNLVIIENDSATATAYAVNIITIYDQYRWRFQQQLAAKQHQPLNQWNGLLAPWNSQSSYFGGVKEKELAFWLNHT